MTEEGKARRAALVERLRARRHAKEVELSKRGAGEEEMSEQGEDLTRLESLAIEARWGPVWSRCIMFHPSIQIAQQS